MNVTDVVSLRRIPSGRYAFSLKQMRERADQEGLDEVVQSIDEAIDQAKDTLDKEMRWAAIRNRSSRARGDAALIDNKIDSLISSIRDRVRTDLVGDDDDPIRQKAQAFMDTVFPDGVSAIIHQPFEVQLGMMDAMIARIESDLSDHVDALGLSRHIDRLAHLIEQFRHELEDNPVDELSFDEVRSAREKLHEATCHVVIALSYLLKSDDPATTRLRHHILRPLQQQQELVAEARRRQRHPTDVDPDTGQEVLEDQEPDDSSTDESSTDEAPVDDVDLDEDVEPIGA